MQCAAWLWNCPRNKGIWPAYVGLALDLHMGSTIGTLGRVLGPKCPTNGRSSHHPIIQAMKIIPLVQFVSIRNTWKWMFHVTSGRQRWSNLTKLTSCARNAFLFSNPSLNFCRVSLKASAMFNVERPGKPGKAAGTGGAVTDRPCLWIPVVNIDDHPEVCR